MFTSGMRERSEKTIKIYDVDTVVSTEENVLCFKPLWCGEVFSEFLKFIYCGKFDEKLLQDRTIEVLAIANKVSSTDFRFVIYYLYFRSMT